MRILIQAYNTCCQNKSGGVQIRVKKYKNMLEQLGYNVDFFSPFETDLKDYDILHIFKLDEENLGLIRCAKAMGKKVVLSSIVNCIKPRRIDFYGFLTKIPLATTYRSVFEIVKLCDCIIAESEEEKSFLCKHYGAEQGQVIVIGNGAEDFSKGDESIFKLIGTREEYVLQVGRFDSNKNQLEVINALKGTNIPLVFIGGPDINDKGYYKKCLKTADGNENIHFLGWIDNTDPILASAYANAKIIIVPSYSETFGLAIVEGIIAGATPIISNKLAILNDEHFKKCITCSPDSARSIREAVNKAYIEEFDEKYIKAIKKDFTWEGIACQHVEIYKNLCAK